MKNRIDLIIYLLFFGTLPSLYHMKFNSLNPLIDVGKDIYCQHDEENEQIFEIKKSGDKYTKVYKIIIPTFTASKMWLKNGTLIDLLTTNPSIGSTNKNDYIPVKEGEQYFFKIFGFNYNDGAPVLFLDEKDNYIQDFFAGSYDKSLKGIELTVPSGAKKMHISVYNPITMTVEKILNMTDSEIDKLCINANTMMEKINNLYMDYAKNPIVYKKIKKAYISFVVDGTWPEDEDYINLLIEKGIKFSLATVPELLPDNSLSGTQTNLELIKKAIKTGKCEILSRSGEEPLTQEKLGNYNEMYRTFIKTKQMFNFYEIEVNGAILARGNGQVISNEIEEKWVSAFYGYSDLYGLYPKYRDICIDSVYYHPRTELYSYEYDVEKIKEAIDEDIIEKNYHIFNFRYDNSVNILPNISLLIDYVKQKEKEGKLEIGNYKEFYEKNAVRMN